MRQKILVSLTTTNLATTRPTWKDKIKEIDKLGLKEIAFFPTCVNIEQRKEIYKLLEATGLEKIPVTHVRHDFKAWEFDYLIKKFKTEAFNIHANRANKEFIIAAKNHLKKIYIENNAELLGIMPDLLDKLAGICLDVSHWEDYGVLQKIDSYKRFPKLIKKYKVGWCHISAISLEQIFDKENNNWIYSNHYLHNLSELDYLKKYKKYLPKICAIELENTLEEQLEVKKYIEKLLGN